MTYLDIALAHAANGWPVFPAGADKRPVLGFTRWEERSTTDALVIREWWEEYSDALPAITPGKAHCTVIDLDRHDGAADGIASFKSLGVALDHSVPVRKSLSGKGVHLYFEGASRSVNGILPGVDRKSLGGYVIAPYALPSIHEVAVALPAPLQGARVGKAANEVEYSGRIDEWVEAHSGATPSLAVRWAVAEVKEGEFRGHDSMLKVQARLAALAASGHGGVPEALDYARQCWAASPHSGDADAYLEWDEGMRSAIRRFGGAR